MIVTEDQQGKNLNKMHKVPGPLQRQMNFMLKHVIAIKKYNE
ncbi:hypothetical protein EC5411_24221 [Escherichia coli 541-1]|nr:hypothetical protein EC5411_24221 [Escherichia coli 541-1]